MIELTVGLAVSAIIALSLALLLKAGVTSSLYALRQTVVLSRSRQAMVGELRRPGLLWACADARRVTALSSSTLSLTAGDGSTLLYGVSGDGLTLSQFGVPSALARDVTALELRYYNLDDAGLVMESTAPESAALATALATLNGGRQRSYAFYSGSVPRNRP